MEFKSKEAAIPLLRGILTRQANHILANYLLGQVLLGQNDSAGIEYIEKAITQNSDIVLDGYNLIYLFLKQQGKITAARSYEERTQQHYQLLLMAQQERSEVRAIDQFQPHNLPDETIQQLCQQLALYPQLKAAYLVQKVVEYLPDKPFYVLGVKRKSVFIELDRSNEKLINSLVQEVQLPSNCYIILLNQDAKNIEKKLRQIPKSAIYQKA